MSRKLRLSIITSLLSFLLSLVVAEVLLRAIDPLGHFAYTLGVARYFNVVQPDPRGYTIPPGTYDFGRWESTFDSDGNRIMPQRPAATCTIDFVGDSVTFGGGVNDTETFAYRIAEALPDVQFVNTAKAGYNAKNLRDTAASIHSDGQIYLAVYNDIEYSTYIQPQAYHLPSVTLATRVYIHHINWDPALPPVDPDWQAYLSEWLDGYPVLIFISEQDGPLQPWLLDRYPDAILIDSFDPYPIGPGDGHPSPEGHEHIADDMLPHVRAYVAEMCP